MLLTDYIGNDCIVPKLKSKNKAGVLKELTHLLFDVKNLESAAPALDQIMARETTESTGIGHGIAVPHARVAGLKGLNCAVGRVPDGIDFSAVDKKPVHLIFLICYPPKDQTIYLNFIATVAKMLRDEAHFAAMLEAKDEAAMFSVLEALSTPLAAPEEGMAEAIKADPELAKARDAHADLILLARLQLCQEMLDTARTGKRAIKQRMDNIRALIDPRILKHYDKLMKSRVPGLVPVEGDTCQGCFMKLPSQYAQQVRVDTDRMHTCKNCSRFIYMV